MDLWRFAIWSEKTMAYRFMDELLLQFFVELLYMKYYILKAILEFNALLKSSNSPVDEWIKSDF